MVFKSTQAQLSGYLSIDPWIALGVFSLGLIAVLIIYSKIDFVLKRLTNYFGVDIDPTADRFRIPIAITFGVFLGWMGLEFLQLPEETRKTAIDILLTIIVVVWTRNVMKFGSMGIYRIISKRYDEDMAPIVSNVWTLLILMTSIGSVLAIWNVNITPLLASAGVLGIVAGFAARDTIANFFGSISLYADETYRKGDFIELDDQTRGMVWDISIRSTQIQTLDGDIVTIPNSKLNNTIIRNKAQPNSSHRFVISFGVSYNADPDRVKEIALDIVDQHDKIEGQPEPRVHLREFGDSSIEFEILCYITHPRHQIHVENDVNSTLYKRLEEEGIEIPYPQRDIHFRENRE